MKSSIKIVSNFIWLFFLVFATVTSLILLFKAIIPHNNMINHAEEFNVGEMLIKDRGFSRGKGMGKATIFLIGAIEKDDKTIILSEYLNSDKAKYLPGEKCNVWFHDKFDRAFLKLKNEEQLIFPKLFFRNIYSAVVVFALCLLYIVFAVRKFFF